MRGYPLLVTVGMALDEALASSAREAWRMHLFAIFGSIAILSFAGFLIVLNLRARHHQAASERTAKEMAQAKDAAETAGKLLRDIADNLPVLIAYLDTERRFRFINKTGELWYGRSAEEILGKTSVEVKLTPFLYDTEAFLERLSRGPLRAERSFCYPDGVTRTVESIIVPDNDPDGGLRNYYRLSTDISARKRLDEKLRETQKLEAIGQLTGGIAHDFNNLLMVIIGNIEILSESGALPAPMMASAAALRASQRGADLTRQLLSFARRQALSPTQIDLNDQIGEIGMLLRRTFPGSIAIEGRPHSAPVFTLVDSSQLNNALLNLALNARDAMKQGGVLTFSTAITQVQNDENTDPETIPAGRYAEIAVQDTGIGM